MRVPFAEALSVLFGAVFGLCAGTANCLLTTLGGRSAVRRGISHIVIILVIIIIILVVLIFLSL